MDEVLAMIWRLALQGVKSPVGFTSPVEMLWIRDALAVRGDWIRE